MDMNYLKSSGGVLLPLTVGGMFSGAILRDGEIIDEFEDHNLVVNQGLNSLLNIYFRGASQISTWYLGLFEGNYTPVATVTAATIVGAATECTVYDESTRRQYSPAAASGQAINNTADRAVYTFNAARTIHGAFLTSDSAKTATTGTLFAAARFGTPKSVVNGDQLLLSYTFAASSAV